MEKLYIKEDITDWLEECKKAEVAITCSDDLIDLVTKGQLSTGQVARHAVVLRQLGQAPDDILSPNKLLLHAGARAEVGKLVANQTREAKMPNGQVYEIREYLACPSERVDSEDAAPVPVFLSTDSEAGLDRAEAYLLDVIPGHIWCRLTELAAGERDVKAVLSQLKAKIDELLVKVLDGGGEA